MLPSEVRCREGAVCSARDKDTVCLSLPARLGAAAAEGAVGRLMIQKPLVGKCAPGRVWSLLVSGSAWQKLRISGRLMLISFSSKSCMHTLQQIAVLLQGNYRKDRKPFAESAWMPLTDSCPSPPTQPVCTQINRPIFCYRAIREKDRNPHLGSPLHSLLVP